MRTAPAFWARPPGLLSELLLPIGAGWEAAGRLRQAFASPYRPPVPVVCVGNLVAGGSGKTPVALALAAHLVCRGIAVHFVTRGYGGRLGGPVRVDPANHDAAAVGDEPLLLAAQAPCWVARDRADGVRAAVAAGAQMVALDDGFQNPGIAKNLALVVVDADYGFGNGRVIPAGPLRESLARGLARADAVVLLGAEAQPVAQNPPRSAGLCRFCAPLCGRSRGSGSPARACWPLPGSAGRANSLRPCGYSAPSLSILDRFPIIIRFAPAKSTGCSAPPSGRKPASSRPQKTSSECPLQSGPRSRFSRSKSAGATSRHSQRCSAASLVRDNQCQLIGKPPSPTKPQRAWSPLARAAGESAERARRVKGPLCVLGSSSVSPTDWRAGERRCALARSDCCRSIGRRRSAAHWRARSAPGSASPNALGSTSPALCPSFRQPGVATHHMPACGTISAGSRPNTRICAESASSNPAGASRRTAFEHIDRAVAAGRRMIIFSGHIANWEIGDARRGTIRG